MSRLITVGLLSATLLAAATAHAEKQVHVSQAQARRIIERAMKSNRQFSKPAKGWKLSLGNKPASPTGQRFFRLEPSIDKTKQAEFWGQASLVQKAGKTRVHITYWPSKPHAPTTRNGKDPYHANMFGNVND